jgi:DNA-binding NarL/FixJ family response regulator
MTPPARVRVLVVDDHEMVAESFRRVLAAEDDIEVIATASTAAGALEAALTHAPDVVLMDYLLPDGDGVAATARIREQLPDVKVVLLTGSDVDQALPGALEAGCVGYLEKTSALDKLAPAVRAAASGEVVISAPDLGRLVAKPGSEPRVATLTRREREVLALVAEGLSNQAIAERLTLSVHTVRSHVQSVLEKLPAHSKLEAVAVARRRHLLK